MELQDSAMQRIMPERLYSFCVQAMVRAGLREEDARTTAEVLVTTDTWGTFTHGTKHLRDYLAKVRTGGIDPQAVPEIVEEGPAWAMIDGHAAIAMVSACMAMQTAIRKANTTGVAYVGVRHSTHFGAAGYYASMAVKENLIGLAMSNADPNMTAPGSRGSVIGNNPFAFAVPAGKEPPVLLDIAMSTVAGGKVMAARELGKSIPETWLVDAEGIPTSDYSIWPAAGSLQPMAAHKGFGLALMIEVLAAVLTGAAFAEQVTSWILAPPSRTDTGHAFIVIDPCKSMPMPNFKERMDRMITGIKQAPKAKGTERIYLPGEMEWERRDQALRQGIEFPPDVIESLTTLAGDWGLEIKELSEHLS